MLCTVMFLTAVFVVSARGRRTADRLSRALDIAGISRKEAAITMRITEQRLSEALYGKSPLSVFRLADLPDAFHEAYDALGVESRGGVVVMERRMALLVCGVERLVMARADVPAIGKKEIA